MSGLFSVTKAERRRADLSKLFIRQSHNDLTGDARFFKIASTYVSNVSIDLHLTSAADVDDLSPNAQKCRFKYSVLFETDDKFLFMRMSNSTTFDIKSPN